MSPFTFAQEARLRALIREELALAQSRTRLDELRADVRRRFAHFRRWFA